MDVDVAQNNETTSVLSRMLDSTPDSINSDDEYSPDDKSMHDVISGTTGASSPNNTKKRKREDVDDYNIHLPSPSNKKSQSYQLPMEEETTRQTNLTMKLSVYNNVCKLPFTDPPPASVLKLWEGVVISIESNKEGEHTYHELLCLYSKSS